MAVQSDGGGVDASIPALVVHAGRVQGVATQVGTAARAGETVMLGQGAYGYLCGFMPAVVNRLQGIVTRGLHTAVTMPPSAFAICTANVPTPPDAPLMSTRSPR